MLVTIVTATTGNPLLAQTVQSVQDQDYDNIEHLIIIDGHEREEATREVLSQVELKKQQTHIICLPYATGKDRYNGHRIYGFSTFIADGDYIIFQDEDNWFDSHHVSSLLEIACSQQLDWAYSLRKIVDERGQFIVNDDCESLGSWPVFNQKYHHVDTSCYFLKRTIAIQLSPIWYRKFREPGVFSPDIALCNALLESYPNCGTTGLYSVNYRIGSTPLSVKAGFFFHGNAQMKAQYFDVFPWRREISELDYREELKEQFPLREYNFFLTLNWFDEEAKLVNPLQSLVQQLLLHPKCDQITILIDTPNSATEIASNLLGDIFLSVLDPELEYPVLPEITLLPEIGPLRWRALNSMLVGQVKLDSQYEGSSARFVDKQLPLFTIADFVNHILPAKQVSSYLAPIELSKPLPGASSFIIISHPGAGSTWLKQILNQHPEIFCAGEILHHDESHVDTAYAKQLMQLSEPLKLFHVPEYLQLFANDKQCEIVGFTLFGSPHHILNFNEIASLIESGYKIIFLQRQNLFDAFCSFQKDDTSKIEDVPQLMFKEPANIIQIQPNGLSIDLEIASQWISQTQSYITFVKQQLQKRQYQYLEVNYEDLYGENVDDIGEIFFRIINYLEVENTELTIKQTHTTENFSQIVENYGELSDYFSCISEHTVNLISTFLRNDQFCEAVETCFSYLEEFPGSHLVQYQLLLGLLLSERQEEAQALLFEIMLQIDSESTLQSESLQSFLKKEVLQRLNLNKLPQAEKLILLFLEIDDQDVWIYQQLGDIYVKKRFLDDAVIAYQKVINLDPSNSQALFNLGIILKSQDKLEEAADCFEKVNSQGVYRKESLEHLRQIYETKGESLRAIFCNGIKLAIIHEYDKASEQLELVLNSHNENDQLYCLLYECYRRSGRNHKSLEIIEKGLQKYPHSSNIKFKYKLGLPLMYKTEEEINFYRERFIQAIEELISETLLDTPEQKDKAIDALGRHNNFLLAYQGQNDTLLQEKYGGFVHEVMKSSFPDCAKIIPLQNRSESRRIRIGYASSFFCAHTVCKLFQGWLKYADKERFEIFVYHLGESCDQYTQTIYDSSDHFNHLLLDFDTICKKIIGDNLDILVYPEIGMDYKTIKLAALRLAPIQCMAWGHPVTSGLPTIDYFLSSDLMEPENASTYYSEQLIKLPNLSIAYEMPAIPCQALTRADFNISQDAIVYLCCQSIFKYLPQYDYIFAAIARQVPNAQFVFISPHSELLAGELKQRIAKTFTSYELEFEKYCTIAPRQDTNGYLSLNLISDIFLDSLGWSGGNTTLEALACNLPVITFPGKFMRGRHTYAALKRMGIEETIAISEADYIQIAVKLGNNLSWRQTIQQMVIDRKHLLFEDTSCITALENFYEAKVEDTVVFVS
jgi:protein O-GlcNAc transferase